MTVQPPTESRDRHLYIAPLGGADEWACCWCGHPDGGPMHATPTELEHQARAGRAVVILVNLRRHLAAAAAHHGDVDPHALGAYADGMTRQALDVLAGSAPRPFLVAGNPRPVQRAGEPAGWPVLPGQQALPIDGPGAA